jgi:uncharacterized membrane-anchored protein YhcB (DUF1043 family)
MTWQDVAVALIVGAALLFLVSRVVRMRRRRSRPAQSFVPLTQLKKSRDERDSPCH